MTILFLDFDGVLHPDAVFLEKARPVLRAEGELFMWAPYLIEALAPYPLFTIVLSTSWVRVLGYSRTLEALPEALRQRVIGATWHSVKTQADYNEGLPYSYWQDATRYQQVRHYVNFAKVVDWIAIDDHPEGWAECDLDKLIFTDSQTGLSDAFVLERLRVVLSKGKQ